jgi:hypothetical protein
LKNKSRAGFFWPARIRCDGKNHTWEISVAVYVSLGFAHSPTIFLRRLFIIRHSLHVPDETFLLTKFLESTNHLLYRFARPRLHFQHEKIALSLLPTQNQPQKRFTLFIFIRQKPFVASLYPGGGLFSSPQKKFSPPIFVEKHRLCPITFQLGVP